MFRFCFGCAGSVYLLCVFYAFSLLITLKYFIGHRYIISWNIPKTTFSFVLSNFMAKDFKRRMKTTEENEMEWFNICLTFEWNIEFTKFVSDSGICLLLLLLLTSVLLVRANSLCSNSVDATKVIQNNEKQIYIDCPETNKSSTFAINFASKRWAMSVERWALWSKQRLGLNDNWIEYRRKLNKWNWLNTHPIEKILSKAEDNQF